MPSHVDVNPREYDVSRRRTAPPLIFSALRGGMGAAWYRIKVARGKRQRNAKFLFILMMLRWSQKLKAGLILDKFDVISRELKSKIFSRDTLLNS